MSLDYLGNPIDTLNPSTRQGLDDFIGGFLGYQPRAESILAAAAATGATGRAGSPRPATGARFPADRAPQGGWQFRDDRAGRRDRAP